MMNRNRNQNQSNDNSNVVNKVSGGIQEGADVVFDAAENTLQATENIAMNAVEQTANLVNKTVKSVTGNQDKENE